MHHISTINAGNRCRIDKDRANGEMERNVLILQYVHINIPFILPFAVLCVYLC